MVPTAPEPAAVAMIHGRFHPFHRGHLRYALLAWARCSFLVVGITNPDRRHLRAQPGDAARHLAASNPFTYVERARMIAGTLRDAGVPADGFVIVPFPVDDPTLWEAYVPPGTIHFLRDRGDWTRTKLQIFAAAGHSAHLLADADDLDVEGTEVRRRLAAGDDWRSLVPPATATVLDAIGAAERVRALLGPG